LNDLKTGETGFPGARLDWVFDPRFNPTTRTLPDELLATHFHGVKTHIFEICGRYLEFLAVSKLAFSYGEGFQLASMAELGVGEVHPEMFLPNEDSTSLKITRYGGSVFVRGLFSAHDLTEPVLNVSGRKREVDLESAIRFLYALELLSLPKEKIHNCTLGFCLLETANATCVFVSYGCHSIRT
jgi:hypothetical protein